MAIAINRELIEDVNNPTSELINYCINVHQESVPHLEKLSNYYNGDQEIVKRTKDNEDAPNNKLMINHAKYVVDMSVGFMVSNPISYTASKDGGDIGAITAEFDRLDIVSHDTELEKDLATFGIGYELIYLKQKAGEQNGTELCIKCIDPRGIFLVTDDTVDKNPLFGVHYQAVKGFDGQIKHYTIKIYTDTVVKTYKQANKGAGDVDFVDSKPHYFKMVPVVEYRNNEERQGDFEQIISSIDAYNLLQSDRLNDKEAYVDAILFLQGFVLEEDEGSQLRKEKLLQSNSTDTNASWLTKSLDEASVELLRKSIVEDMHKITYVPNMNDENFMGNVSGEAMKYKLFGLLQSIAVKSRYLTKGLRQRLELFANILGVKDKSIDVTGVKIDLKPNLPINTAEIISMISQAQDFISLETLLAQVPFIDNPKEELAKLREEQKENIQQNQLALGEQSSHNDIDDEAEGDEDGKESSNDSDDK